MGHVAGNCKHFNGSQNQCCEAGVDYEAAFDGKTPGMFLRMPCTRVRSDNRVGDDGKIVRTLRPNDRRGAQMIECQKFEAITEEESAAADRAFEEHLDLLRQDLSSCCKAPLDRSQLLTSGRFKGNGWVFCSKCKASVMHVCART